MRTALLKGTAAICGAALLLTAVTGVLPQRYALPEDALMTVSAAEDDYPWSTYLKKSADWFGTSEAIAVADACIRYQVAGEGGWQKGMATAHTGDWAHSTIDNDATTSQIRFLMRTYGQTGDVKYLNCALRGIDCLFKMQYDNGGWMQCLNTPGTYHAHITLNDGAYMHVMNIMKEMASKTGDFTAVSDDYANKAAASMEKGIQCLLNMQIEVNGVKTAWCQQHDAYTLKPAAARAYELPSVCTSESVNVVTFFYQLAQETGRQDLIQSVNAAIRWFQSVTLTGIKFVSQGDDKVVVQDPSASPLWARFYDLDKMIPLFSDRDGSVHYDVAEISQERRTGYAWYGNWGKNVVSLPLLDESGTTVPVEEPVYTGHMIASVKVHDLANAENWSIREELAVGKPIYGDRDFTFTTVPACIQGAEYVSTACNSKSTSGDLAELTAGEDIVLYALVDMRLYTEQGIKPAWLNDWQHCNDIVTSSNTVIYEMYSCEVPRGQTITLGSNMTGNTVVNYLVAAVPRIEVTPSVTTTAAAVTTTTTTATTTTVSEAAHKMTGDVDVNGTVELADAVLLAKSVGQVEGITLSAQGRLNAECDGIGTVDSGDLGTLLSYIAGLISSFPV